MLRPLFLACVCLAVSCRPDTKPEPKETVYHVSLGALTRDYLAAKSYAGFLIEMRLSKYAYEFSPGEIRIMGEVPGSPPLVIFHCAFIPNERIPLVIQGRCLIPRRDGIWRTPMADFYVTVEECSVFPADR